MATTTVNAPGPGQIQLQVNVEQQMNNSQPQPVPGAAPSTESIHWAISNRFSSETALSPPRAVNANTSPPIHSARRWARGIGRRPTSTSKPVKMRRIRGINASDALNALQTLCSLQRVHIISIRWSCISRSSLRAAKKSTVPRAKCGRMCRRTGSIRILRTAPMRALCLWPFLGFGYYAGSVLAAKCGTKTCTDPICGASKVWTTPLGNGFISKSENMYIFLKRDI